MEQDREQRDVDELRPVRRLLQALRRPEIAVLVAAAAVVVTVAAVSVVGRSDRDTPDHLGSVERPAPLGDGITARLIEYDETTVQWRYSRVTHVMEAPRASESGGRCFVTFGLIDGGYVGPQTVERPLSVAFAVNGVVAATGDADLACNAQTVERAAESTSGRGGRMTLDQAVEMTLEQNSELRFGEKLRAFVTVTYVLGDVEPDSVVLTSSPLQAGQGIPGDSAIYTFRLSDPRSYQYDPSLDAWNEIFGFGPVVSDA